MNGFLPAKISVSPPPRGGGSQTAQTFLSQSFRGTFSWGTQPGTATIVYIGLAPVTTWALVEIEMGALYFCGYCKSDVQNIGSREGQTRTLQFVDNRAFLKWDVVFGVFNKLDNRLGYKRYKHLLPGNWSRGEWVYSIDPMPAWQILQYLMQAPTIGSPWTYDLTGGGLFPLGILNGPLYDFDCESGKRLDEAMSELCERTGTVFTLASSPTDQYHLVWTRKGYGSFTIPPGTDDRRVGISATENPQRVNVVGGRNLYQMSVSLAPDWNPAWEQFLTVDLFADDIYNRATDPLTGIAFNQTPNDPEQYIGRSKAAAYARQITVKGYVDLRNATSGDGDPFADYLLYNQRCRMDLPAALYIQTLLFRAFRPDVSGIYTQAGYVPMDSVIIADRLLCRVTHNPATGDLLPDINEPTDGNGYAIVKGYNVGEDFFATVKPEQFDVSSFKSANALWQQVPFQIDDSGDGNQFIIFETPVFVSDDNHPLLSTVNGYTVFNADGKFTEPPAQAYLCFEAERFSYWLGGGSYDAIQNVASLCGEYVQMPDGSFAEMVFEDGSTATGRAFAFAQYFLLQQITYADGGIKIPWNPQTDSSKFGLSLLAGDGGVSSLIDRVEINSSATGGTFQVVDLTTERQRDYFEPERDLDRKIQLRPLFPGQAELRQEAQTYQKLAAGLRQTPGFVRWLMDFINGGLMVNNNLTPVRLGGSVPAGATLAVGTPICKKPNNTSATPNTNTLATYPPSVDATLDTVFVGVTVRNNEDVSKQFYVQSVGETLARVEGPVVENDAIGLSAQGGSDYAQNGAYLVKGGTTSVGVALQPILGNAIQLIKVRLGVTSSSSNGGDSTWLP